ncbi:MAG: hypothetical protein EAZ57_00565 [Cytophagales bacterium]|nr:MAG: hypothetical protein EAZ67_00565 [Cytophagales bacterium]TAF62281.1 MAG: hypothetical protein EAZ57_00565 [Cytophagales bacterium]
MKKNNFRFLPLGLFIFISSCIQISSEQVEQASQKIQQGIELVNQLNRLNPQDVQVLFDSCSQAWNEAAANVNCFDPTDMAFKKYKGLENKFLEQYPVTDEEEIKYGEEFHKTMAKDYKLINQDPRHARIEKILNKMLPYRERKSIPFSIHLMESDVVNAFAIAGGHLYVTTALLDFVESEDELAGIIGHEIAHVDRKHLIRQLQKIAVGNHLVGGLGELAASLQIILTAPFGQIDEYESDKFGADFSHKAGYDPRKMKDFFARLKQNETQYDWAEKLMRTHPYSAQREACLEAHIVANLD